VTPALSYTAGTQGERGKEKVVVIVVVVVAVAVAVVVQRQAGNP